MRQCLWKGIDRHPHSHSVAFATSPAHHLKRPVSKGIKTARLPSAYLVVNNRVLKTQNIRTRQAHIGAFPTVISWPQTICSSGSSRSRDTALLNCSQRDFPPMLFQLLPEFTALCSKKFCSVFYSFCNTT